MLIKVLAVENFLALDKVQMGIEVMEVLCIHSRSACPGCRWPQVLNDMSIESHDIMFLLRSLRLIQDPLKGHLHRVSATFKQSSEVHRT